MIIKFSDFLTLDDGIEYFENSTLGIPVSNSVNEPLKINYPKPINLLNDNKKVYIQGKEYRIISLGEMFRSKGSDGRYHAIYLWINYETGEYYIGKVNRAKWKEIERYKGSGVLFQNKYNKNPKKYTRYYIYVCDSEKETEKIESQIVNESLLDDPFCLNLIKGGGGVPPTVYSEERKAKQSQYMKEHPERYKAMIIAARNLDEKTIQKRIQKTKETMSSEEYKEMTRERIKRWKTQHPEEYQRARVKNKQAINNPNAKKKKADSLNRWKEEHPQEYLIWEENRKKALANPLSRQKRGNSQKKWIEMHPDEQRKRHTKSIETRKNNVKGVAMINPTTKEIVRTFKTPKEAADWLRENGYTSSVNPASSICAVCQHKEIPGHGTKKTAYGFCWEYVDKK